jgi:hypothetical protein
MSKPDLTISVTEFKARCLAIFDDLEARRLKRVVVTRRRKPVAELTPPAVEVPSLWGCMRGTVHIPPGVDLTEPSDEEWEADERNLPTSVDPRTT